MVVLREQLDLARAAFGDGASERTTSNHLGERTAELVDRGWRVERRSDADNGAAVAATQLDIGGME